MSLTLKSRATTSARSISGSGISHSFDAHGPQGDPQIQPCPADSRPVTLSVERDVASFVRKRNQPDGYRIELIGRDAE